MQAQRDKFYESLIPKKRDFLSINHEQNYEIKNTEF